MSVQRAKKKNLLKKPPARRSNYHHGNLRDALIEATLHLIKQSSPEKVTVREASRQAGVSSGAPFRHFPNRTALMTAVAEQAMQRLRTEIMGALAETEKEDPLTRFTAIGKAYFRWVIHNPTHFQVISNRSLIDFEGSESLCRDNEQIRAWMEGLLLEAQRQGMLRCDDLTHIQLAGRALVYGLARMYLDGHFTQWDVAEDKAESAMQTVLDLFIDSLSDEKKIPVGRKTKTQT
ncbi:MAG: TetR/AcrR family transcriptional regulator [Acidobacteriota bacterium]